MRRNGIALMVVFMVGAITVQQVFALAAVPSLLMGTRAVNVSGMIGDDGDNVQINMNGSFGYFIKDFTQLGISLGVDLYGSDYKALDASVFSEYNLDLGTQVVPYAGVSMGLIWIETASNSDTAIEATGFGGARYFFVDYAAIGAELVVSAATEEIYNGGEHNMDWAAYVNTSWYF